MWKAEAGVGENRTQEQCQLNVFLFDWASAKILFSVFYLTLTFLNTFLVFWVSGSKPVCMTILVTSKS